MVALQEPFTPARRMTFMLAGTVVTLLLMVATGSFGPSGMMLNLVVAVPVAYVHMRCGLRVAAGAVALIVAGLFILGNLFDVLSYLVQFGLLALFLPAFLHRGWNWDRAAAASIAACVFVVIIGTAGFAIYENVGLGGLVERYVEPEVQQFLDLSMEKAAETDGAAATDEPLREQFEEFFRYTYLGLIGGGFVLVTLLLLLFLAVLGKGQYEIPGTPFADWKAPELMIWPMIAAGFSVFTGEGIIRQAGVNLLFVLVPIYFMQGLAIITHYFNRRQVSPFLRALGYMLVVTMNPLPLIVTGIGVFDLWVDFRKPRIKKDKSF